MEWQVEADEEPSLPNASGNVCTSPATCFVFVIPSPIVIGGDGAPAGLE